MNHFHEVDCSKYCSNLPFLLLRLVVLSVLCALMSDLFDRIDLYDSWLRNALESRSYKHATRQPRQPSEATQQPTVVKASQGYHWKALSRFYKQVDCRFSILVLKEVWRRQVKWALSPCWKHCQHERHLRNNKPSNGSFKGRNRKRLSRFTSWCIVVFVYFYSCWNTQRR